MSAQGPLSATRLLGLNLTPGKLRGLQRISNDNGTLTMVATDQNNSLYGLLKAALEKKGEKREPTYSEMVEAKIALASALTKNASAILVDGYYGYWNTLASMNFARNVGVLIRVEKSGGEKNKAGAPLGAYEPGWSVEKIKRCGADAVKLLAPFEPTEPDSAEHQFAFLQDVYAECQKHDILLLLETVAFPFNGEDKKAKSFMARKAQTVIDSARYLSRYCDIYKAEFPGHFGQETDAQLEANLKELDRASERPWVLLSAGVDYPDYKKQVEMAMKAGASGVLGGRAFWKEYFSKDGPAAMKDFAHGEASDRVRQIDEIVKKSAKPWFARYGLSEEQLHRVRVAEGWHFRYGEWKKGGGTTAGGEGAY